MPSKPGEECCEIALQNRAEVGVGDGRAGALELADLRQDVGGAADVAARHLVDQDFLRAALVGIVDVAVEEAHRHRLDAALVEPRRDGAQARLVERLQHLAFVGRALGDGHGVASVDKRGRRVPVGIVERGPGRARSVQNVGEASRGHERGAGASAHDDRVGGDGGADLDELDVARASAPTASIPASMPSMKSGGVDAVFAISTAPVSVSWRITSVNVPPTSTAST